MCIAVPGSIQNSRYILLDKQLVKSKMIQYP